MGSVLAGCDPDAVMSRTSGWEIEPFADMSGAFVFVRELLSVLILHPLTWYVLEMSDGRTVREVAARAAAVVGGRSGAPAAALATLTGHDLVSMGKAGE